MAALPQQMCICMPPAAGHTHWAFAAASTHSIVPCLRQVGPLSKPSQLSWRECSLDTCTSWPRCAHCRAALLELAPVLYLPLCSSTCPSPAPGNECGAAAFSAPAACQEAGAALTHLTARTLQVSCDEVFTPCCRGVLLVQHCALPGMCSPSR